MVIIIYNHTIGISEEVELDSFNPKKSCKYTVEAIDGIEVDLWSIAQAKEFVELLTDSPLSIDEVKMLSQSYLMSEIVEMLQKETYPSIINFDEETAKWNCGNGVPCDEWWKGRLLLELDEASVPYLDKETAIRIEDYIKFESLWQTAETEGWRDIYYGGSHYLVFM